MEFYSSQKLQHYYKSPQFDLKRGDQTKMSSVIPYSEAGIDSRMSVNEKKSDGGYNLYAGIEEITEYK